MYKKGIKFDGIVIQLTLSNGKTIPVKSKIKWTSQRELLNIKTLKQKSIIKRIVKALDIIDCD